MFNLNEFFNSKFAVNVVWSIPTAVIFGILASKVNSDHAAKLINRYIDEKEDKQTSEKKDV